MIIKQIELQNFRTIKEFSQEFSGNIYLITGENELGKSTLLSAILALITGDRPENLLTIGEKQGFAKAKIGTNEDDIYEVELRFSEKSPKGTLRITDPNGMKSDTKTMLQKIFNYHDFDANYFVNLSTTASGRREQVEMVKKLLPAALLEEMEKLQNEVKFLKEERTGINAKVDYDKKVLGSLKISDGDLSKYSSEIDTKKIYSELSDAQFKNHERDGVLQRKEERAKEISSFSEITEQTIKQHEISIDQIQEQLERAKKLKEDFIDKRKAELEILNEKQVQAEKWLSKHERIDDSAIMEKLTYAQQHNDKFKEVEKYFSAKELAYLNMTEQSDINEKIKAKETRLKECITEATLPVEGLTFSDDGLFLNGVPFKRGEVSTSQEMEVAVKLIMAINPKVKVFRIAQGESLGADKLKSIVDFAKNNGYQGFIENVVRGQKEMLVEEYSEI